MSKKKDFEKLHYQCPACGSYNTSFVRMLSPSGYPDEQIATSNGKSVFHTSWWRCNTCLEDFAFTSIRWFEPKWDT